MNDILLVVLLMAEAQPAAAVERQSEIKEIDKFLKSYNSMATILKRESTEAAWKYESDLTEENLRLSSLAEAKLSDFKQRPSKEANQFNIESLANHKQIFRQLEKIKTLGIVLDANDTMKRNNLIGEMSGIYGYATICGITEKSDLESVRNCSLQWSIEPEIAEFMAKSRNFDDLAYVFNEWHRVAGDPLKNAYRDYVDISNKGARRGGFADLGHWWRWNYEEANFDQELEDLWHQVLPLYESLHTYVRKRLVELYKGKLNTSALPAHILGDMWAQDWSHLTDILLPYPSKNSCDITEEMLRQNYTVDRMFRMAEEFVTSLGLGRIPDSFWKHSVFEKPDNSSMVCHASAWDFYTTAATEGDFPDIRVKMCSVVNKDYLIAIHHEMGHLVYFLSYINQPLVFRDGANPGFHEAIGDTLALSAVSRKHLHAVGLLSDYNVDFEEDINFLFKMALEIVAFLPFAYLVDKWRYDIFSGKYDFDSWNSAWWEARYAYQGMVPPATKTHQTGAFDPGAKYHVSSDTPYSSYFVSAIIQFQFYKAMCDAAGHQGALHHCDFYGSRAAGKLLGDMMELGSSEHWSVAMKMMTGQGRMDAEALLTYFQPLSEWLNEANKGECFGWGHVWPPTVLKTLKTPRCDSALTRISK